MRVKDFEFSSRGWRGRVRAVAAVGRGLRTPLSCGGAISRSFAARQETGSPSAGFGNPALQPNACSEEECDMGSATASGCTAFSLIEVVFAVAIFTLAITAILALLPSTVRQVSESRDTQAAARLGDAVLLEMQHLAAQNGFDSLATGIPVMDDSFDTGLLLVASRDSPDVRPLATIEPVLRDQYFLVELRRFPAGQLAYDPAAAYLALSVRVSWPYRALTPQGLAALTEVRNREQALFTIVINR